MTKIFISYSRVDSETITKFALLLGYGCDVWYDKSTKGLIGGEDWWQRIILEVEKCDHFIYLLSPESVESEYCAKELNIALERDKHIIPVRVRDRTKYPESISHLETIDAFGENLANGISRIYGSIMKNSTVGAKPQLTEAHRQADLRLIDKFWSLLPSWYFSRQLEEEYGGGYIRRDIYFDRVQTFEHNASLPEFTINLVTLNEVFREFVVSLQNLILKTSIAFTSEGNQVLESNYHYIMSGKSSNVQPYRGFEKDIKIIEIKRQEFEEILDLYQHSKDCYLEIIASIQHHYPEFDFEVDEK